MSGQTSLRNSSGSTCGKIAFGRIDVDGEDLAAIDRRTELGRVDAALRGVGVAQSGVVAAVRKVARDGCGRRAICTRRRNLPAGEAARTPRAARPPGRSAAASCPAAHHATISWTSGTKLGHSGMAVHDGSADVADQHDSPPMDRLLDHQRIAAAERQDRFRRRVSRAARVGNA